MTDSPKIGDALGLRSFGEAIQPITKGVVEGAAAFLGRICLPAAEEFGLLLRDKIGIWRAANAASVAAKAEAKLKDQCVDDGVSAPPRIVAEVVDQASWTDTPHMQEMWAGLLASSCTPSGDDDSNIIFVDLLKRLTSSEARIFSHACAVAEKRVSEVGWLHAYAVSVTLNQMMAVSGIRDQHRLSREVEHLSHLGLIEGGFAPTSVEAEVTPTGLGLQMYARCQGCLSDPAKFLGASRAESIIAEPDLPAPTRVTRISLSVLVVDDEPAITNALRVALERSGYRVTAATTGDAALAAIGSNPPDILIIDLRMPDTRGDVVFELAAASTPHLRRSTLFMTGDISDRAKALIASTKCDALQKPFTLRELLSAVDQLAARRTAG